MNHPGAALSPSGALVDPTARHDLSAYHREKARRLRWLMVAALTCALAFALDVATGPAFLSPWAVVQAVLGLHVDPTVHAIVWSIRLPVACMALLVGLALGLSGVTMQTILHNPLASSYTLGISAGAGFGASLVIVLGWSLPWVGAASVSIATSAMVFAGLACAGVYFMGGLRGASAEALVLAGIALLFLFQALTSLLQMVASPEALQQIVFWLFGSLQRSTWDKLAVLTPVVTACTVFLLHLAWPLTAMKLGDDRARAVGVRVERVRLQAFVIVSVLTGMAVAFVGTIGFVGLVAPHVARMLVGEDHRILLPMSGIAGALLLSAASVASKIVIPGAIFPIGIVTSLIGVPFFVLLVLRSKRRNW